MAQRNVTTIHGTPVFRLAFGSRTLIAAHEPATETRPAALHLYQELRQPDGSRLIFIASLHRETALALSHELIAAVDHLDREAAAGRGAA